MNHLKLIVLITLSIDQRKKTDDEFLTDVEAAGDEVLAATAATVDALVVATDEAAAVDVQADADVVVIKKGKSNKIRKTRKKTILKN